MAFLGLVLAPVAALAVLPPHVAESPTSPEACAICHRAHTSNVDLPYRTMASTEPTGNSLIVAPPPEFGTPGFPKPNRGDVGLCFTCHGAAGLGSQFDVESSFSLESTHSIAPLTSTFGPSPKMCGSCHDPHGTARTAGGAPYPRLLRSWVDTTTAMFTQEEYCATCHKSRSASRFDSVAVYRRTGHYYGMPDPASGTRIRCSNCHAAHGSAIAPLITSPVVPTAAPTTTTIAANDRRLCIACHPDPAHSWSGETTYALSAHAISAKTVPIPGEWPAAGAVRRIGECQVCHAPMGRDDGAGGTIAKLLEKPGRQLCDTCHQAAGPATTNIKALAYPTGEATAVELVVAWAPDARSSFAGRTDLYGRATSGPDPLIGPRAYAAPGASGAAAVGDVDGDGRPEVVRASAGSDKITILHGDPLLGLAASAPVVVAASPDFVAIGRFVAPTAAEIVAGCGPLPQIAIVDGAAGQLYLYENMVGGALTLVDGPIALGGSGTGLAAGDFTGGPLADLAVTTQGAADQLLLFTQDTVTPALDKLAAPVTVPGLTLPRGPSVGDVNGDAANEVIVCLEGGTVPVFSGAGTLLSTLTITTSGKPWASAIGDVLSSVAGNEVAVAVRDTVGLARVSVFSGAGAEFPYDAPGVASGSVLVTDIDGDAKADTLVGDAGEWNGALGMSSPAVDVFGQNALGTALVHATTLLAGDSALAGQAPSLLIADFGPALPSRHPIDEVAASHVSTETGSFARHVTCSDCHDSHEASSGIAAAAPLVTGDMRGAWGFGVTNTGAGVQALSGSARAKRQYEVCFKCHATTAAGRTDIAALANTLNASVHAVEDPSAAPVALAGSYEPGWSNGSVLYCTDCHGDSVGTEAKGLHRSAEAPLLKSPYTATPASEPSLLCYDCHLRTTYRDGAAPAGTDGMAATSSIFYDSTLIASRRALHHFHSAALADGGMGFACSACHVGHGSATEPHLLRGDIGYAHETAGIGTNSGTCDSSACHSASHAYVGP